MGRLNPSRETKFSGTYRNGRIFILPVQLTTSRIGNLTRLTHTLLPGICDDHTYGGLSLFDESFPNEDATSASRSLQEGSTKPPWGWVKPSRKLREGFSVSSRNLQRPRRLHEALMKTSRTLREGATARPLRECFMKAP